MPWRTWASRKHNDGRRNSAVGYNSSRWHFVDGDGFYAVCGKEVQIPRKTQDAPPPEGAKVCKICEKIKARG